MSISDWRSDVCSSDLVFRHRNAKALTPHACKLSCDKAGRALTHSRAKAGQDYGPYTVKERRFYTDRTSGGHCHHRHTRGNASYRQRDVKGKSVTVRVDRVGLYRHNKTYKDKKK